MTNMALPLVFKTEVLGLSAPAVLKVVDVDEFVRNGWPPERCVFLLDHATTAERDALCRLPWAAVMAVEPAALASVRTVVRTPSPANAMQPGDVIEIAPGRPTLRVLYRRGDVGNVLFATERCNSYCLMCSQPPRAVDDRWRIRQNLDLIGLIDRDEPSLAITGGEPTLLGEDLVSLIRVCAEKLPDTDLQILTNGRAFAASDLASKAASVSHPKLQWNVPLYADVAPVHDYVVQANGAFHQTVSGLYRLAEMHQNIEIRVVLAKPTVPRLKALAHFIYRNLSFVRHVALMGVESIGFALANREELWMDPVDYQEELAHAASFLADRGIRTSIYNLPLCVLPRSLWPLARQSISTWKNLYLPACAGCTERTRCAGFFASIREEWTSRGIAPIRA